MIKHYTSDDFLAEYHLLDSGARILNAGSASRRYGTNCVNVDIQDKPNVDVVCDLHDLPDSLGLFDAIICNAVLQYCRDPRRVATQFYNHLKPGGYVYVNVPWVQPYCVDMPDLFRFSEECLRLIFSDFQVIRTGCYLSPGEAFAMLGTHIAQKLTTNRYVNFGLRKIVGAALFPFKWITTSDNLKTAGALYMICRRI